MAQACFHDSEGLRDRSDSDRARIAFAGGGGPGGAFRGVRWSAASAPRPVRRPSGIARGLWGRTAKGPRSPALCVAFSREQAGTAFATPLPRGERPLTSLEAQSGREAVQSRRRESQAADCPAPTQDELPACAQWHEVAGQALSSSRARPCPGACPTPRLRLVWDGLHARPNAGRLISQGLRPRGAEWRDRHDQGRWEHSRHRQRQRGGDVPAMPLPASEGWLTATARACAR
jgi:hypothetical protein